jgi:hypothetical protein
LQILDKLKRLAKEKIFVWKVSDEEKRFLRLTPGEKSDKMGNTIKWVFTQLIKILFASHFQHSSFCPSADVQPMKFPSNVCLLSTCVNYDLYGVKAF